MGGMDKRLSPWVNLHVAKSTYCVKKGLLIVIDNPYSKRIAEFNQEFRKALIRPILQDHSRQSGRFLQ